MMADVKAGFDTHEELQKVDIGSLELLLPEEQQEKKWLKKKNTTEDL